MSKVKRIALFNAKGGCGKTTLAWNLAMGLSRRGTTLLLDADSQGSLGDWADWAAEAEGHALSVQNWSEQDAGSADKFAYWVIDCPPSLESPATREVLAMADWVLLPVLPSPLDLWASQRSVEVISALHADKRDRQAAFVLNQVENHSALSRATESAVQALGLTVLPVQVARRAIYRNAAIEGKSVYQMGKRATAAVQEFEGIIEEILK
ncbi:AAA family ATPase [Acidithiobacillus sp. M4-SHS-6]|uniref:AAA family ATPase n=1 Tax=Acidithiobacillus sp. M4-SHS-6 TaxID=3383024 RepID=UPI0039BE6F61